MRTAFGLVLRDRSSRNGTYVNGARVREASLEVGMRVQIGSTTLEVLGATPAAETAAADKLVGDDPAFRAAVDCARRGAGADATVLLVGESGTGKELFAHLVHEASGRAGGPFVAVNCGAISPSLVESELFGHERGAFTGADKGRRGVFEQAHAGTLFLDEIGELPGDQQPRLLRVLETRRIRRVGAEGERRVDVRVVAATHRELRGDPGFRPDLYHRLAAIEIRLPPLRERPSDILPLAERFLAELARDGQPSLLGEALARRLGAHPWTGNIRELRNAMQRFAVMGSAALEEFLAAPPAERPGGPPSATSNLVPIDQAVRDCIAGALARHPSVRKAAAAAGMKKSTFYDKARRMGLLGKTG